MRFGARGIKSIALAAVGGIGIALALSKGDNEDEESQKRSADSRTFGSRFIETEAGKIHYLDTGEANLPLVIFIHGTPGSWKSSRHLFHSNALRGKARLVTYDRPGFGKAKEEDLVLTLKGQAAAIRPLLDLDGAKGRAILVGHSLGGPIAVRAAIDYPEEVGGLLLVAPTLDPELEDTTWYQALGRNPLFSWLVPKSLSRANKELENLKSELREMLPLWEKVRAETIVIQGGKDKLVDPGNADFVKRMLPEDRLDVWYDDQWGHFVYWKRPELMERGVLELLEEVER